MTQEQKEKIRNILYNNKCIADYNEEDPFVGVYFSDLIYLFEDLLKDDLINTLLKDHKLDLINAIDYEPGPI